MEWHHSQVVRQSSAKASPPVQIWVVPPKKALANQRKSFSIFNICCCGGIGRHKGLKIPRGRLRTGSSPVSSTTDGKIAVYIRRKKAIKLPYLHLKIRQLALCCKDRIDRNSNARTRRNVACSLSRRVAPCKSGQQHHRRQDCCLKLNISGCSAVW